jgi:hypothetical protein
VPLATSAGTAATASNVTGLVTITNDVIIFAETAGDNIGLESITYPIGDSQTDSAWLGYSALYGSTGYHNSAVGENALRESPGIENAAMGYSGLYASPGSYNAAIGAAALFLSPGLFNFGAGYQAGAQAPGDSNIFIGAYAGFGSPATNAICIGVRSAPLGNNSMVLGNAGTTNTQIKGNVTISSLTVTGGGNVVTNGATVTNSLQLGGVAAGAWLRATNTPSAGQMLYATDTSPTNLYFGAAAAGGGGNQTPLTNNVNAAGYAVTNANYFQATNAFPVEVALGAAVRWGFYGGAMTNSVTMTATQCVFSIQGTNYVFP